MAPPGYPSIYMLRARQLYEAGWSCTQISRMLESELGRQPNPTTIRKWVDPDYNEVVLARRRRGGVSGPNREKTWKFRLRRMRELREQVGLSFSSIAGLMSHDFEDLELTEHHVRSIFKGSVSNKTVRRLLYPASSSPSKTTTEAGLTASDRSNT